MHINSNISSIKKERNRAMLKQEFESRVGMQVTPEEYSHINEIYNNADVDKDEFCKLWVKMNQLRVKRAKAEAKAKAKQDELKGKAWDIISKYGHIWNAQQPASKFLQKRERLFCYMIGIEIKDMDNPYCSTTLSTVIYQLRKFCKA